jgi:hypothetical protein
MALTFTRGSKRAAEPIIDPYKGGGDDYAPEPLLPKLPPFSEHAGAVALTAQTGILRRLLEEREARVQYYAWQREKEGGVGTWSGQKKAFVEERMASLREAMGPGKAEPPVSTDGIHPDVREALALAEGGALPERHDREADTARLKVEIEQIKRALQIVGGEYSALRDEMSVAVYRQYVDQQRAVLVSKFEAAMGLVTAVSTERQMIAEMLNAGYVHLPDIWLSPPLRGAAMLGTTSEWDSEISTFRRTLQQLGII